MSDHTNREDIINKKHGTLLASFMFTILLLIGLLIISCMSGQLVEPTLTLTPFLYLTPSILYTSSLTPSPTLTPEVTPTPMLSEGDINAIVETACHERPAATPETGISTSGTAGARVCPDVTWGIELPDQWIANTPGNLSYVVDISDPQKEGTLTCGPYTKNGEAPTSGEEGTYVTFLRQYIVIILIDAKTGKEVDHKKVDGPGNCPPTIGVGSSYVEGDHVSLQAIQDAMINLLSPLLPVLLPTPTPTLTPTLAPTPQWRTLTGNSFVAFSPDGKLLATGSQDKAVMLWDTTSGKLMRTLGSEPGLVNSVAFSPDGKWLASGSQNGGVKLWDVASGDLLRTPEGQSIVAVRSVAFSPDGKWLASGGSGKTVMLWNAASGQIVRQLISYPGSVNSLAFSPDGKLLASGGFGDGTVKLWDTASGDLLRTLERQSSAVISVAFSPDGKWLASGGDGKTVKLWDVASGDLLRTLEGHSAAVISVAFSPDGKLLASGSGDGTVKLWDTASGNMLRTLENNRNFGLVWGVAFSPDGRLLALVGDNIVKFGEVKLP